MIAHLPLLCCLLTADVPPMVHAPVIEVASRQRRRKRIRQPVKPPRQIVDPAPVHAEAPEPMPTPAPRPTEFEIRWNAIGDKVNLDARP